MQLKRWDTKEVIFELECNSWGELLKGALKANVSFYRANFSSADFRGANFSSADFRGANFRGADFRGADFRGVDFRDVDFRDVDFRGANFRYAHFRGANFSSADFRGANFSSADFSISKHQYKIGNMREWHSMQLDTYEIGFNNRLLCIGCQQHTIKEWKNFTDDEISKLDDYALEWWNKWKEHIFKSINLCYGESDD